MKRAAWVVTTALVVLVSRSLAYALEPSPLARELEASAGGPRLWVTALVALLVAHALAAGIVWLAAIGVEERRRLERRLVVDVPSRPRLGRLVPRVVALFLGSSLSFALFESTLHWHEGLGWHGLSCLTGPVHRDAIPILAALSLLAAAGFAAAEHVTAWMRRTLAQFAAVAPPPRLPVAAAAPSRFAPRLAAVALQARGPPVAAC